MIVWILVITATALVSAALGALVTLALAARARRAAKPGAGLDSTAAGEPGPDRAPGRPGLLIPLGVALAGALVVGAVGVFVSMGEPVADIDPAGAGHPGGDAAAMVAQLEGDLARNPGDVDGWATLGWSYMRLDRPADAARAFARAAELDPTAGAFRSDRGEALTVAAGGEVTAEALAEFEAALAMNAADPVARYYLALARDQSGDRAGAIEDWLGLLREAPPGSPLDTAVRQAIESAARDAGIDVSARLASAAPAPALAGVPGRGPTAEQLASAQALTETDRNQMIAGMVEGLAARLAAEPRDAEGWATLMRSRMTLGQPAEAAAALRQGLAAFADSPAEQARLRQTAQSLGVPGL